jgi:hypothetical protein
MTALQMIWNYDKLRFLVALPMTDTDKLLELSLERTLTNACRNLSNGQADENMAIKHC